MDIPSPSCTPPAELLSDPKLSQAFLPDEEIARHWLFRFFLWIANFFYYSFNGYTHVNFVNQRRDKASLFYTRHSTHNADILTVLSVCYEVTGRVSRALMHRLILVGFPWVKYLGAVAGERASAVALLRAGFWSGVIPGGADEALVGHENCYKVVWPSKRVGFAQVAMDADALLIPFFMRNSEESRWNPLHELFHHLRLYRVFEFLVRAKVPFVSRAIETLGHAIWLWSTFVQLPVPVRVTLIFGDPVPYDAAVDSRADVVQRCQDALQQLIVDHQPAALEGRNYARALGERWVEWRSQRPALIAAIERATPGCVVSFLKAWARGRGTAAKATTTTTKTASKKKTGRKIE